MLHIASVSTRMRGGNMVAPLAAVAVGGYGRSELAPGSDLDLLFLLPESNQSRAGAVEAATETCIKAVVAGLWDLGFVLDQLLRLLHPVIRMIFRRMFRASADGLARYAKAHPAASG